MGDSSLPRELVRKLLHLLIALIVPVMNYSPWLALSLLSYGVILYIVSEQYRLEYEENPDKKLPTNMLTYALIHPLRTIKQVTVLVSRHCESSDIVWAPVFLAGGAMAAVLLFPPRYATVGIYCLALGDTAALFGGKIFKGPCLPLSKEKSYSGAIMCWIVCAGITYYYSQSLVISCLVGGACAFVESLQIHNADNIMIPVTGALSYEVLNKLLVG